MDHSESLARAIQILGGPSAAAAGLRALGFERMTPSHIRNWIKRDKKTPAEVCRHLEALVAKAGGDTTRYDLRPDVFGDKPAASSVAAALEDLSQLLTEDENRELLAAIARGPESALGFVRGLEHRPELKAATNEMLIVLGDQGSP